MNTESDEDAARDREVWDGLDYETRLAAACHVIRKVVEVGRDPGSFRHFIYGVLGFQMDAYVPLYAAGAMEITNNFDLNHSENLRKVVEEHKYDSLKEMLDICDEFGCYEQSSCGFPTSDGYRRTCYKHSEFDKKL